VGAAQTTNNPRFQSNGRAMTRLTRARLGISIA
jgi:hypothetical protein